jgi:hypothetical protein
MGTRGRYAYWLPLVLLGFLILSGIVLTSADHHHADWFAYTPLDGRYLSPGGWYGTGTGGMVGTGFGVGEQHTVVGMSFGSHISLFPWGYWFAGVLMIFLATVVWYGWRSGRKRAFLWIAACGSIAVAGFLFTLGIVDARPELRPTIGGSLVALGICAGAWVYFRLGPGGKFATALSATSLATGAGVLLAGVAPAVADELIVVCGLLVLAWLERSRLLAVVAVVFFAVAWFLLPGMAGMAMSAGVLLLGGICALVLKKTTSPA